MYLQRLLKMPVLLLLLCCSKQLFSQQAITGIILDAATREPLAGATIYIDQTQLIAQSNSTGYFRLANVPANGTLVVSYTGYEKFSRQVNSVFGDWTILLEREDITLAEVQVTGSGKDNWRRWGKLFTNVFLGKDLDEAVILENPQDIWFQYDKSQMILRTGSRNPLRITNRLLGYTATVELDSLVYAINAGSFVYALTEYFEFADSVEENLAKQFAAARLIAYRGSRMHFIRSVFNGQSAAEGFRVYRYAGRANLEKRRVEAVLLQRIAANEDGTLKETGNKVDLTMLGRDTSFYYKAVLAQPGYYFSDSLPFTIGDQLAYQSARAQLKIDDDSLLVIYNPAINRLLPDQQLLKLSGLPDAAEKGLNYEFIQAGVGNEKFSLLYLLRGSTLQLNENGFLQNAADLFIEGAMANRRGAYDLPWDYAPEADEQLLLQGQLVQATDIRSKISNTLFAMGGHDQPADLYLHPDKTIYDPGENIWFSAWLLNQSAQRDTAHTLYVVLQQEDTRQVVATEQFQLNSGIGSGYIYLADSFPSGRYNLLAYTNSIAAEQPPVVFSHSLVLRDAKSPVRFQYNASDVQYRNDSVYFAVRAKLRGAKPILPYTVRCTLLGDGKSLSSTTVRIVDTATIRFPGIAIAGITHNTLSVRSEVIGKEERWEVMDVATVPARFVQLRLYPEGGNLVAGIPNRVWYEVNGQQRKCTEAVLQVMKGDSLVAVLNMDKQGTGAFEFVPETGAGYSVIPASDSVTILPFAFPEIINAGLAITVERSVVTDSLRCSIRATEKHLPLIVLLHDYKNEYLLRRITLRNHQYQFSLPAADLPEGISTLTIFDEQGRPMAEHALFREPARKAFLQITTDSGSYDSRSKVQLLVKATNQEGQPVQAMFSLAAVMANTVDTALFQDIVPFAMFNRYYNRSIITNRPDYSGYQKAGMETWLNIFGWTRYKWNQLDSARLIPPPFAAANTASHGYVLYEGRRIKEPVDLALASPVSLHIVRTDSAGNFEIPREMMQTLPDMKITMTVQAPRQAFYKIIVSGDREQIDRQLAKNVYPVVPRQKTRLQELIVDPGSNNAKLLQTVYLKATNSQPDDPSKFIKGFRKQREDCKDYVCMYNILNCINHPGGAKPVQGAMYLFRENGRMKKIVYRGCTDDPAVLGKTLHEEPDTIAVQVKGVYITKEFYVADYQKYNPPFPETNTTVYWNPLVRTDANGEARLTFYTNDLKGMVRVVAQGITAETVCSGKKQFRSGK